MEAALLRSFIQYLSAFSSKSPVCFWALKRVLLSGTLPRSWPCCLLLDAYQPGNIKQRMVVSVALIQPVRRGLFPWVSRVCPTVSSPVLSQGQRIASSLSSAFFSTPSPQWRVFSPSSFPSFLMGFHLRPEGHRFLLFLRGKVKVKLLSVWLFEPHGL